MIIRIQKSGGSFVGAGKYYLHDKAADKTLEPHLKPKTDERVWFTDTRNCLATDPERAFAEMWRVAEDQQWLKRQVGARTSGRVCQDPVKTLSLSWHKEDAPTPEHIIEAADAYLKHMGWQEHQAVFIGHNDTEHRHIHIVVNRVHPETGRTLDDYREKVRSQNWALAYEKEQGRIWCEERENNARARKDQVLERRQHETEAVVAQTPDAENVVSFAKQPRPAENTAESPPAPAPDPGPKQPANDHLPHNVIMMTRPLEKQFGKDEKSREELDELDRDVLKADQRAEREGFFKDGAKQFRKTRHSIYDQVRKEYAPEWRQFYKDEAAAQQEAEARSESALSRAFYFAKQGQWPQAKAAFNDRDSIRDAVARQFAERKAELKARQMEELRGRQKEACDQLREHRDREYKELLKRQRKERAVLNAGNTVVDQERREYTADLLARTMPVMASNQNADRQAQTPDTTPDTANVNLTPMQEAVQAAAQDRLTLFPLAGFERDAAPAPEQGQRHEPADRPAPAEAFRSPEDERLTGRKDATDLVAGGLGALAGYVSDQLMEFFSPTPPEVREARAREEAKREAAKPPREPVKESPWAKHVEAAVRLAEEEREEKRNRDYWTERERKKDFERDR